MGLHKLHVWLTKEEIEPERLRGATAIVMDVLLATTTMVEMIERGASGVYPVASVEEAHQLAERLGHPLVLRGGEEDGERIASFDRGPMPKEYANVNGYDVVFLSTNGTRAISKSSEARELYVASLRNADATAEYIASHCTGDVYIICAGTRGHFALEDALCARRLVGRLVHNERALNDAARWLHNFSSFSAAQTVALLEQSSVGRWLVQVGEADVLPFVGGICESDAVVRVVNGKLERVIEERGEVTV